MNWFSARTRITAGLAAMLSCLMLAAISLGLVPDRFSIERKHRAQLCETLAIHCSVLANRNDVAGIRQSLTTLASRHPEIVSAGVRDRFGKMIVELNNHNQTWPQGSTVANSETHIQVPVFRGSTRFAIVELCFEPLEARGIVAWILHPWTLLLLFVNSAAFVGFWLYLGFMLRQLNPSQAVPGHVRRALNNLAEGLMVLDVQGRMVLVNSAFEAIVGLAEVKLLGRRPKIFQWSSEDHCPLTEFPWDLARATGQAVLNSHVRLRSEDGRVLVFNVNCAPISTSNSRSSFGVMVSLEDITQIDEAKVEIQKSRDEAEAANRAKSDFLANMSHEIRTPMNAILGFTELLRRGMVENKRDADEYLSTIHTSGSHLLDLINDILDLSKIESGKMELELIECAPFKLLNDVTSILRTRAQDKKISLTIDPDSKLPERIVSDPVRIRQVITNLVGNAIKFTNKGGVRIEARVTERGMMQIQIHDTGIGMTAAQMERIFNPFAQADSSVTRQFGGTGLGLSISRRIARALGGDVTAVSSPGEGSTFSAEFEIGPLQQCEWIEYSKFQRNDIAVEPSPRAIKQFGGQRVLAVDDGEANLRLIRLILEKAHLVVDVARNGKQAIDQINLHSYSLVFMDMQMPVLDGYSATRKLRDSGCDVPIIAMTAHALRGEEEKCLAAGCTEYMTKPIQMDHLIATVARYVSCSGLPAIESKPMREKLTSRLPLDPDEVRDIVSTFHHELCMRLVDMQGDLAARRWDALAKAAHWLKGAGGTVGFPEFVEPSTRLESAARGPCDAELAARLLAQIDDLAQKIDLADFKQCIG